MIKIIIFFLLGSFSLFIINRLTHGSINNLGSRITSIVGVNLFKEGSKLGALFDNLVNLGVLNKEIEKLRNENTALVSTLAKTEVDRLEEAFLAESEKARSAFGDQQISVANIFSGVFDGFKQNLLLNKGEVHGIIAGDSVVTKEGVLIGRVSEVFENFSTILVVSDLEFKATARVLDSNTEGIVRGVLSEGLVFDLITQGDSIQEDDTIVTSGSDVTPGGLIIGRVRDVDPNETDFFKTVKITPGFNANYQGPVLIIRI